MGLLDQILGAALGGQQARPQGEGGLGGLGDLLSGLAGGRQQGQGGGANLMAALLPVLLSMLANRAGGSSSGGAGLGGLGGLLQQFQAAGLGQHADSWVGAGENMPVSADDLARVFGRDQISQIAAQAGVSEDEASSGLASLLPEFVNQLTPQGQMPHQGELDDSFASLQRSLGL
jgi:uncharacterized protein YidB (DUF937 family)